MKELVNSLFFSDADMTTTMNTWRYNHSSWMKEETQDKYWQCKTSKQWNAVEKQAFSAYLQHISGNKWLLHKLIELPLVVVDRVGDSSEDSPSRAVEQTGGFCTKSTLTHMIQRWNDHKNSEEYRKFLLRSKKRHTTTRDFVLECAKSSKGIRREHACP